MGKGVPGGGSRESKNTSAGAYGPPRRSCVFLLVKSAVRAPECWLENSLQVTEDSRKCLGGGGREPTAAGEV